MPYVRLKNLCSPCIFIEFRAISRCWDREDSCHSGICRQKKRYSKGNKTPARFHSLLCTAARFKILRLTDTQQRCWDVTLSFVRFSHLSRTAAIVFFISKSLTLLSLWQHVMLLIGQTLSKCKQNFWSYTMQNLLHMHE